MPPKIDQAILSALSLDTATTTIASHGGSGFANTFKLVSNKGNNDEKLYFVKIGKGESAGVMFEGVYELTSFISGPRLSIC
jgi:protein-ribulosamine 3-kinase